MAFTPKLTYKGKPLVRKDNELYYGRMTDPYVLYLQILTTTPVGDQQVADKVHLMLPPVTAAAIFEACALSFSLIFIVFTPLFS